MSHAYDPQIPNRPSSRETSDEERRRTVLLVNGKGHPLNGDARRIRIGLPGLRWARSVCNPGWTPLASRCDKQSFPLRAATTDSRPDSVRCTFGAWRSNPCVEVAAPLLRGLTPKECQFEAGAVRDVAQGMLEALLLQKSIAALLQKSIAALNAFAHQ